MIIHIKHDTVNGEVGVSADFTEKEKSIVNKFCQQLIDTREFVPSNSISDLPFSFFVASYFLSPQANIVALTCVYVGQEVLRPILSFITLKLPLNTVNPFVVAKNIMNRRIRDQLLESVKDRKYEIEVPDEFLGQRLPVVQNSELSSEIRKMKHVPESSLYGGGEPAYRPFITFWPFENRKSISFEKTDSIYQTPSQYSHPTVGSTPSAIVNFEKKDSVEDVLEVKPESYTAEQIVDKKPVVTKQPPSYRPQQAESSENTFISKKWHPTIVSYIMVAIAATALTVLLTKEKPPTVHTSPNSQNQDNSKPKFSLVGEPIWLYVGEYTKSGTKKRKLINEETYKINKDLQMFESSNIYYVDRERPVRDTPDANKETKEKLCKGCLFIKVQELYNDEKSPDSKFKDDPNVEARWWQIRRVVQN